MIQSLYLINQNACLNMQPFISSYKAPENSVAFEIQSLELINSGHSVTFEKNKSPTSNVMNLIIYY